MKLDIDGIQVFVLVAALGGFSKAAEKLHLSQTVLSRRIQKLERYLGLRLLDRTTRSVVLTRVGREFLPRAARLVDDLTGSLVRLKDMSREASSSRSVSIPTWSKTRCCAVRSSFTAGRIIPSAGGGRSHGRSCATSSTAGHGKAGRDTR